MIYRTYVIDSAVWRRIADHIDKDLELEYPIIDEKIYSLYGLKVTDFPFEYAVVDEKKFTLFLLRWS